jgi:hypothetical protein
VAKVRRWLSLPEAELFRKALDANVAVIQAEALELYVEGTESQSGLETSIEAGTLKLITAHPFSHTLEVMQQFDRDDALYFHIKPEIN